MLSFGTNLQTRALLDGSFTGMLPVEPQSIFSFFSQWQVDAANWGSATPCAILVTNMSLQMLHWCQ